MFFSQGHFLYLKIYFGEIFPSIHLPVVHHISGSIHHVIIVFGTLGGGGRRGVKGQEIAQIYKKFCLSCSISQKPCIIWFSFMVRICKMIISIGFFFPFFKILMFWVIRTEEEGGKRAKNGPKWQKRYIRCTPYLRKHTSFDCRLQYTCVRW